MYKYTVNGSERMRQVANSIADKRMASLGTRIASRPSEQARGLRMDNLPRAAAQLSALPVTKPLPRPQIDFSSLNLKPIVPKPPRIPKIDLSLLKLDPIVAKPHPIPKIDLISVDLVANLNNRVSELERENAWLKIRLDAAELGKCSHSRNENIAFGCYYC